jgi:antitoxin StbD
LQFNKFNIIISTKLSTKKELFVANQILSEMTASVSELKRNPMGTVAAVDGFPVAILNNNQPSVYCVPAKAYEALMSRLEDLELNAIADERAGQARVRVNVEDL